MLTLEFLNVDNRKDLPQVSYSTALDRYVGTCYSFVIVSIIQFAGVHYFTKHGSGEFQPDMDIEEKEEEEEEEEFQESITDVGYCLKGC